MFKIFKYLKWQEWLLLLLTFGVIAVQVWCNTSLPDRTFEISEYFQSGNLTENWNMLIDACVKMVLYTLGIIFSAIIVNFLASLFVIGNVFNFSSKADHSLLSYTNRQPSNPFVTTNSSPNTSRNLEGIISLPFASIV